MRKQQPSILARTFSVLLITLGVFSHQAIAGDGSDTFAVKSGNTAFSHGIPVNDPTYCFGENDLGQCVLFYGSANSCNNVSPCIGTSANVSGIKKAVADVVVGQEDLTFCYGLDNDTDQCKLFVGSEESCNNVAPCSVGFKRLSKTKSIQLSR